MQPSDLVLAAGAVVWREVSNRLELLLVHRARYDDWTFPKGKVGSGERFPVAACRETREETGLTVRLGVPLRHLKYPLGNGATKRVSYWTATPVGDAELAHQTNDEVDDMRWLDIDTTAPALTYDTERRLLADFNRALPHNKHRTVPLIVLRHAKAIPRRRWDGDDDRQRPLADQGCAEAQRLIPLLTAYGVENVVSSDSTRCVQTIEPYAGSADVAVTLDRGLSQGDATSKRVARRARLLLANPKPALACTHRPVLPLLCHALGVDDTSLHPAQALVLHRQGGTVMARERHRP